MKVDNIILGIESSCDDTGAAIMRNGKLLANVIAGQEVHSKYGGVVPELASRAHQKNIVPTVDIALKEAGIKPEELSAIAYTKGPGLLGSLLVGASFAKSMAIGLDLPLIGVDHMRGHILSHFIVKAGETEVQPEFPFLSLVVSGGHTQLVIVHSAQEIEVIGKTLDDAVGEAFDKTAKMLGLPYPGGPVVDKLAREGQAVFEFNRPRIQGLDMSFSGLKTSILYFLQKKKAEEATFIQTNINDICASVQTCIVEILMDKINKALKTYSPKSIALAGGVAANSALRQAMLDLGEAKGLKVFIPPFEYCTDNAAMIAMVGHLDYSAGIHSPLTEVPKPNLKLG